MPSDPELLLPDELPATNELLLGATRLEVDSDDEDGPDEEPLPEPLDEPPHGSQQQQPA